MTKTIYQTILAVFCLFTWHSAIAQTSNAPYTIPVVFHVIHDNGAENIPDSLITNMLANINQRFGTADTTGVAYPFVHIVANMQIDFCLAHTDPSGLYTTGIERISDTMTYHGDIPSSKLDPWPNNKYLNIWIVHTAGNSLAYSVSPAYAAMHPAEDGIMTIATLYDRSQRGDLVLTTMIGKWLNLTNTWGTSAPGVACGDDGVYDTPVTKGSLSTCDTARRECDQNTIENVQNYMDFSSCPCMFTNGQRDRVYACLDTNIAGRNNLWTAANLALTCSTPTGINEAGESKIRISPNPFDQQVTIKGLDNGMQSIQVYDISGRLVWSRKELAVSEKSISIDLSAISSGIYVLTLTHQGQSRSIKIIKDW